MLGCCCDAREGCEVAEYGLLLKDLLATGPLKNISIRLLAL
jgi:hypothetical protein